MDYESVRAMVLEHQRLRVSGIAAPGTKAYEQIVDGERAAREMLRQMPEHVAAQRRWLAQRRVVRLPAPQPRGAA